MKTPHQQLSEAFPNRNLYTHVVGDDFDDVYDKVESLLSSRDTYWKERVAKRDNEWRDAIKYLINNSEGNQDWFSALRACKSITLPIK